MGFLRRTKRACVLGCGPAGLFAVHALATSGWKVTVYSNKRRSEMFGAQYLHKEIPGLSGEPSKLEYKLVGKPDGYRRKVYGPGGMPAGRASVDTLQGIHDVWDIREAYYNAWEAYQDLVLHLPGMNAATLGAVAPGQESKVRIPWETFDLVVSSLPVPTLCYRPSHASVGQEVWAIGDAPERGIFCPIKTVEPMTVVCNGVPDVGWYRAANVFGYRTAEWPANRKPPYEGVAGIEKPLATTCDCWTSKEFMRVGRFGTWTKGVLAHTAYYNVKERIS